MSTTRISTRETAVSYPGYVVYSIYGYSYVLSFIHVGGIHKHFVVNLQLLYRHSYTTTYSLVPIFPLPIGLFICSNYGVWYVLDKI